MRLPLHTDQSKSKVLKEVAAGQTLGELVFACAVVGQIRAGDAASAFGCLVFVFVLLLQAHSRTLVC